MKTVETWARSVALEILEKQIKCQTGEWQGVSLSAIIEVRTIELLNALAEENDK